MLPAERTHYRRGLALGMTLAELFSVIVFVLLLIAGFFLNSAAAAREEAEDERDEALVSRDILHGMMVDTTGESFADADVWIDETLRLREDTLRLRRELDDALERQRQALERLTADSYADTSLASGDERGLRREVAELRVDRDVIRAELEEAQRQVEEAAAEAQAREDAAAEERRLSDAARQLMGRDGRLSAAEADTITQRAARAALLRDSLDAARLALSERRDELRELRELYAESATIDSLRQELSRWDADVDLESQLRRQTDTAERDRARAERDRDQAVARAEYRERQLDRLRAGGGIDPPPCWSSAGRPEYAYRVTLTDGGYRMTDIAPSGRWTQDPEAAALASAVEEGTVLTPEGFSTVAMPFYRLGANRTEAGGPRGCRFYVEVEDRTGADKNVYKERMQLLERYFFFRRVD